MTLINTQPARLPACFGGVISSEIDKCAIKSYVARVFVVSKWHFLWRVTAESLVSLKTRIGWVTRFCNGWFVVSVLDGSFFQKLLEGVAVTATVGLIAFAVLSLPEIGALATLGAVAVTIDGMMTKYNN